MEQLALVCIDNIECIAGEEEWEMAIFDLYNRILETGKTRLLITGDRPPRQLNLKLPDLASRLDWGRSTNCSRFPTKINCRRCSCAPACAVLSCLKMWAASC